MCIWCLREWVEKGNKCLLNTFIAIALDIDFVDLGGR